MPFVRENDRLQLWSLLSIMKIFPSNAFATILSDLEKLHRECEDAKKAKASGSLEGALLALSETREQTVLEVLEMAERLCKVSGFENGKAKLFQINRHYKHHPEDTKDLSSLSADLRNAKDMLMSDFWQWQFIQIKPEFATYTNNDALFGEEVHRAFPSATFDIREAGNCIAVDCATAAVFHLMRAVEWGLRAFCKHLGLIRIRRSKKPGKVKYVPMEYSEWEKILEDVREKVDTKINKMSRGKSKQQAQEFYYPLLQDLRGFRDAWRNHVMHTRREYSLADALAVMEHVKRFMRSLAEKVSE
jgi:hypothetical protein